MPDRPGRVGTPPAGMGKDAADMFRLAVNDRDAAAVLAAAPQATATDAVVCFHAQQAVEKSMKALLLHLTGSSPDMHSISGLAGELRAAGSAVPAPLIVAARLDRCAVKWRYAVAPGGSVGIRRDEMVPLADSVMQWVASVAER